MNSRFRKLVQPFALGACLLSLGLFPGCLNQEIPSTKKASDNPRPAMPVIETQEVKLRDFVDQVELPVTIEGYESASLVSRVDGYIKELLVDIGDSVVTGQVLARLDLPEMKAEITRKTRMIEQAQANLHSQRTEVIKAESQLAEQNALLKLRKSELHRMRNLVAAGALKQVKLDEANYAYDAVEASLERIHAEVNAAKAHATGAVAAVKVSEAELEKSRAIMSYSKIQAPFNGVITARMVDPGAYVSPPSSNRDAQVLFQVERVEKLKAVVMLAIEEGSKLNNGDPVQLHSVRGIDDQTLHSIRAPDRHALRISRHTGVFHPDSRMMRAEIDLDNPIDPVSRRRPLKPGDYGKAIVQLEVYEKIPSLPVSAIRSEEPGSEYVLQIDDSGICRRTPVQKLHVQNEMVAIGGEIQAGDRVIVSGFDAVKDGQVLRP